MNIKFIKDELAKHLNEEVIIKTHAMRNKTNYYEGILYNLYPHIFTIKINNQEKSFSYHDLITKDIKIKYPEK